MSKINLPVLHESALSQYIADVNKFPMLDEQEEFMLATRFKEEGDITAAHKLVTSHLRLVVKIAMSFRGYGLPLSDVISEGNIGLMQAVKKFEPSKGFRLSTYAMWWIKAAIHEFVLKSWSIVKVGTSAAQKKLFYNLKRLKNNITGGRDVALSDADMDSIAGELDVTSQEVKDMNQLMSGGNYSLNTHAFDDSEEDRINYLEDTSANQEVLLGEREESDDRSLLLQNSLAKLNERERDIITKRRLIEEPFTLEDLSGLYGISRERVRQIENKALEKLQSFMLVKAA